MTDKPTVQHDPIDVSPSPGPSYQFRVEGFSNYPIQRVVYQNDMYNHAVFMVYQNAGFDLLALVMAKLGQVMSEADVTGDVERAMGQVDAMSAAINAIKP